MWNVNEKISNAIQVDKLWQSKLHAVLVVEQEPRETQKRSERVKFGLLRFPRPTKQLLLCDDAFKPNFQNSEQLLFGYQFHIIDLVSSLI